ncbi:AbrB family transcriptional regulator [Lactobacillus sp. ESL0679]|uniref:AbrB family transcriptional regulator n=1 Tax=Lactobacillus sp. ESL0679 TaxID=2983209 RepID=UPI0023F67FFB|nr:AbrB family transcriptional regulator [Lactobacillus sp. ESL0679]MDF7682837.1 AbrB family transcriptional regulator [Lactobacillus sp. ESL0679]
MQNPADLTKETKLFKTGNSWVFRVLKQDKEFLHADSNTRFKKTISPDGRQITFTKIEEADPNLMKYIEKQYKKHQPLMERLKNL